MTNFEYNTLRTTIFAKALIPFFFGNDNFVLFLHINRPTSTNSLRPYLYKHKSYDGRQQARFSERNHNAVTNKIDINKRKKNSVTNTQSHFSPFICFECSRNPLKSKRNECIIASFILHRSWSFQHLPKQATYC